MPFCAEIGVGLRLALRARTLSVALGGFFVLMLCAFLAAQFSGRQPATVALDIGLSVIRFFLPLVIVLLVQELLSREFDRRCFLSSLSYPRARAGFLLGRFAAVLVFVMGQLMALGLLLAVLVFFIGKGYGQATPAALDHHYLITLGFMAVDLLVLTALAALLAIIASTPSFVLIGTFGFMLVARSFGAIIDLLSRDASLIVNAESYRGSLGLLGYLLPDLGALDVRMLALYSKIEFLPVDWPLLLLNSLCYAVGLLAMSVWALQRKRFA